MAVREAACGKTYLERAGWGRDLARGSASEHGTINILYYSRLHVSLKAIVHVYYHGLPGLFPRLGPIGLLPGLVTKGVRRAVIGVDLHALPILLGGLAELRDLLRADPLVG